MSEVNWLHTTHMLILAALVAYRWAPIWVLVVVWVLFMAVMCRNFYVLFKQFKNPAVDPWKEIMDGEGAKSSIPLKERIEAIQVHTHGGSDE